jgi:hypothetical protein
MQSVSPAVTPEPVITSQNVVHLAKVVVGGVCVMSLLGVTAYSIKKR